METMCDSSSSPSQWADANKATAAMTAIHRRYPPICLANGGFRDGLFSLMYDLAPKYAKQTNASLKYKAKTSQTMCPHFIFNAEENWVSAFTDRIRPCHARFQARKIVRETARCVAGTHRISTVYLWA